MPYLGLDRYLKTTSLFTKSCSDISVMSQRNRKPVEMAHSLVKIRIAVPEIQPLSILPRKLITTAISNQHWHEKRNNK